MDNLYYEGGHPGFSNIAEGIRFSPDVLATFLRKIYHGFDTSNDIELSNAARHKIQIKFLM